MKIALICLYWVIFFEIGIVLKKCEKVIKCNELMQKVHNACRYALTKRMRFEILWETDLRSRSENFMFQNTVGYHCTSIDPLRCEKNWFHMFKYCKSDTWIRAHIILCGLPEFNCEKKRKSYKYTAIIFKKKIQISNSINNYYLYAKRSQVTIHPVCVSVEGKDRDDCSLRCGF